MFEPEKKSISKSIRLTPTVYAYINHFAGTGFNEKLGNIVLKLMTSEKKLDQDLHYKRQELQRLEAQIQEKRAALQTVSALKNTLDDAQYQLLHTYECAQNKINTLTGGINK